MPDMISEQAGHWLRLSMLHGIGPMQGRRLVRAVGDIQSLWSTEETALQEVEGVGPATLNAISRSRPEDADAVIAICQQQHIGLICPDDSAWPESLNHVDDAPLMLLYRGDAGCLRMPRLLGVVGARRASREGALVTRRWSRFLAARRIGIVSGMAYGIDAAAHAGALEAESATIAVLGMGLLSLTEQQQAQVDAIAACGCVVSEFLPHTTARPEYFPRRNRIIAALSHAVLVMEADVRSGSLITARLALEYGKEVFAVPGSVLAGNHAGCHRLIRDGAILAEQAEDVLQTMGWMTASASTSGASKSYRPEDPKERKLLQALAAESMHLDHLAETCGLTVPELSPILLRLELQGVIERLPGSRYMIIVELSEA